MNAIYNLVYRVHGTILVWLPHTAFSLVVWYGDIPARISTLIPHPLVPESACAKWMLWLGLQGPLHHAAPFWYGSPMQLSVWLCDTGISLQAFTTLISHPSDTQISLCTMNAITWSTRSMAPRCIHFGMVTPCSLQFGGVIWRYSPQGFLLWFLIL